MSDELPPSIGEGLSSPVAPSREHHPGSRDTQVTFVAVANFVIGGIELVYGVYLLLVATIFGTAAGGAALPGAGVIAGLVLLVTSLAVLMGLLMIVAGMGLLRHRPWARTLTLILGGLAIVAALASLSPLNLFSLLMNVGYAAVVFVVLLNRRIAVEFGGAPIPKESIDSEGTLAERAATTWPHWQVLLALVGSHLLCVLIGWMLSRTSSTNPELKWAEQVAGHFLDAFTNEDNDAARAVATEELRKQITGIHISGCTLRELTADA